MKNEHNCSTHGKQFLATSEKPYRFMDSGLSHVYLVGIKYWVCEKCGSAAAEIPALEPLMLAIAKAVVMKPALLAGEEIRFLRKRAGKRAVDFAELINKTPEHLSKLENDQLPLPEETDKLIRLTYGMLSGDAALMFGIMNSVEAWLRSISGKKIIDITFKKKAGKWTRLPMAA